MRCMCCAQPGEFREAARKACRRMRSLQRESVIESRVMPYRTSAYTILAMTFLLLSMWPRTVHAERPGCDDPSALFAEGEVDYLKTWEQVYGSFKRYSACDDGVIAEGYSDAVVKMLADRWQQLPTLRTLIDRDERFGKFVFMHIDATTDDHDLDRVLENASRHCPQADGQLCSTIKRRAVAARSEQDKIYPPNGH
jgi:hypothetical protein